MNTKMIVSALAAAMLTGSPVLAADSAMHTKPAKQMTRLIEMTPAQKCWSLGRQFDAAIKKHEKLPKSEAAKLAHKEGVKLCAEGKHAQGSAKLEEAMVDIGVHAKTKYRVKVTPK